METEQTALIDTARIAYHRALFGALAPLIFGVSVYVLWLQTGWGMLMDVGLYTILGGCALLIPTLICSIQSWRKGQAAGLPLKGRLVRVALVCVTVLASFSSAALCVNGAMIHEGVFRSLTYRVTLRNLTEQTIRGVRIYGGGVELEAGDIGPGEVMLFPNLRIRQDGNLRLSFAGGPKNEPHVIDEYVTRGMGMDTHVTFERDGTIEVENLLR